MCSKQTSPTFSALTDLLVCRAYVRHRRRVHGVVVIGCRDDVRPTANDCDYVPFERELIGLNC
jgi:hypothetical protein